MSSRIDDDDFPPAQSLDEADFWATEYDRRRPVPKRLDELVIYEMHVGGLGFGKRDAAGNPLPGSFRDAIALLVGGALPGSLPMSTTERGQPERAALQCFRCH